MLQTLIYCEQHVSRGVLRIYKTGRLWKWARECLTGNPSSMPRTYITKEEPTLGCPRTSTRPPIRTPTQEINVNMDNSRIHATWDFVTHIESVYLLIRLAAQGLVKADLVAVYGCQSGEETPSLGCWGLNPVSTSSKSSPTGASHRFGVEMIYVNYA